MVFQILKPVCTVKLTIYGFPDSKICVYSQINMDTP